MKVVLFAESAVPIDTLWNAKKMLRTLDNPFQDSKALGFAVLLSLGSFLARFKGRPADIELS